MQASGLGFSVVWYRSWYFVRSTQVLWLGLRCNDVARPVPVPFSELESSAQAGLVLSLQRKAEGVTGGHQTSQHKAGRHLSSPGNGLFPLSV